MMKIIHVTQGHSLSLQVHDNKQESWILTRGKALVIWEDETGKLVETEWKQIKDTAPKIGQSID